ncbi:hypothetical protein E8P82_10815 [Arthrobacter echini]|uniref:Tryptophan-rich sensory protein n=1 Tax=Arthrobacter echini TaxID=1529066 RepID=A0A4S5E334_9MICC|nr:TspO/MBR family protein [Arthrobacter echini]THJ65773.1 hypothetical protein E8P82_10815 [Arthrobacter echini]
MSTPKSQETELPDTPDRTTTESVPASDTSNVLERLKAARPRTAGSDASAAAEGTTAAVGSDRAERPRTSLAGADDEADADVSNGKASATSEASGRAAVDRPQAGADRRRAAVEKTRIAAGTTGLAVARSSRATGQAIGRGSRVTSEAVRRGSRAAAQRARSWDRDVVRQSVVTLCAIACILGSAAGVGVFGGPSIAEAAGGLFSPDATLLAPSSTAFSIWSVIYVGLVAYTAFQWLPSQRRTPRQRLLGWIVAASMLLNLAWILSAQAGLLTLSLIIIMLLFVTLLAAIRTLNAFPNATRVEGALVETPIGLYFGWILLAAAANAAAFLTSRNADLFGWEGTTWAIVGITAVLITAAIVCSTDRGRLAVAAATSWGLVWIAVERLLGDPEAIEVAFAATLAAFLLIITAGSRRHRVDHAYRRRLRAQQDAQREPLNLLADDRGSLHQDRQSPEHGSTRPSSHHRP